MYCSLFYLRNIDNDADIYPTFQRIKDGKFYRRTPTTLLSMSVLLYMLIFMLYARVTHLTLNAKGSCVQSLAGSAGLGAEPHIANLLYLIISMYSASDHCKTTTRPFQGRGAYL